MDITLVKLDTANPQHARVVAQLILMSELSYGEDLERDSRLLAWREGRGQWMVAVVGGRAAGVAMVEQHGDAAELVWLEVLPAFKGKGIGKALLAHIQGVAEQLIISSVRGALAFYAKVLEMTPTEDGRFVWTKGARYA